MDKITNAMLEFIEEFIVVSVSAILSLIPFYLGGSAELAGICILLFFFDFFIGVVDANRESKFNWLRFKKGIDKIASLFFALAVVGIGVYSYRLTYGDSIFGQDVAIVFNTFVFLLVIFELQSINRHFARMDKQVNIFLDVFFTRITSKIISRIFNTIDKIDDIDEKKRGGRRND